MTAADLLIVKSSLLTGTAAAHLLSALALGSGVIVNDGIYVEVTDMTIEVEVELTLIEAVIDTDATELELEDQSITIEVEEW